MNNFNISEFLMNVQKSAIHVVHEVGGVHD
jgi:hypothetical protein